MGWLLWQLLEVWPAELHSRVHVRLARIHAALSHDGTQEAEAAYHAALSADPDSAEAHRGLAATLASRWPLKPSIVEEAESHFRAAMRLSCDDADVRVELAELLASDGRWGQPLVSLLRDAAAALEKAPSSQPQPGASTVPAMRLRVLRLLARAQLVSGAASGARRPVEEAVTTYQQAVAQSPSDAALRYEYGVALFAAGASEKAAAELVEATRLKPQLATPHVAAARVLHRLGRVRLCCGLRLAACSTPLTALCSCTARVCCCMCVCVVWCVVYVGLCDCVCSTMMPWHGFAMPSITPSLAPPMTRMPASHASLWRMRWCVRGVNRPLLRCTSQKHLRRHRPAMQLRYWTTPMLFWRR